VAGIWSVFRTGDAPSASYHYCLVDGLASGDVRKRRRWSNRELVGLVTAPTGRERPPSSPWPNRPTHPVSSPQPHVRGYSTSPLPIETVIQFLHLLQLSRSPQRRRSAAYRYDLLADIRTHLVYRDHVRTRKVNPMTGHSPIGPGQGSAVEPQPPAWTTGGSATACSFCGGR